ncbi:uncharacterized protein LOC129222660 [Uloborus diversus]|uniref:uncharacterized protein LOC129222660 n=1 Tax=Uloborus diversus TaxID=327109 RepID=UPI00240A39CF|nr:uncharacterized protein LOC129222660 [Uloborus diversus]
MQLVLSALIFSAFFIGGLCTRTRRQIDNLLDDEEEDYILTAQTSTIKNPPSRYASSIESEAGTIDSDSAVKPGIVDPQVQGLNIGLYFVLQDINRRIIYGHKIPLESLIKVLVLTFKIQNAGGVILGMNKDTLAKVAALYPKPLKEAIAQ